MKQLSRLLDEFILWRQSLNLSPRTVTTQALHQRLFLRRLEAAHAVTRLDQLRAKHLYAYQHTVSRMCNRKGLPIKPASANQKLTAVRSFLRFLFQRHCTGTDLSCLLHLVKEPSLLPTSVLTHREVRKLLRYVDTTTLRGTMHRAVLELLYSSGIRVGELLGLSIEDVDIENGIMRVMGKGSRERMVPIGRTALRRLESYLKAVRPFMPGSREHKSLFLTAGGRPLTWVAVKCTIAKYTARAGLEDKKVTAHTFRRSCTTELVRSNANLYHVKELLGHSTLNTLNAYTKLTIVDLKKTHARCHPRERDEKRERG